MSAPETSIVIRTFNEKAHLPALLETIESQRYRDYEIINVDSGSYDKTTEIARRGGARVLNISSHDFTFGFSLNKDHQLTRRSPKSPRVPTTILRRAPGSKYA